MVDGMRGSAVFLIAISAISMTYALWMRSELYDTTRQCAELRSASEANREAAERMRAEMERRDAMIADRDAEIRSIRRQSADRLEKLERMGRENERVANWSCGMVPFDVLVMLKGGDGDRDADSARAAAENAHGGD